MVFYIIKRVVDFVVATGLLAVLAWTGILPILPSQYPDYHAATYLLPPASLGAAFLLVVIEPEGVMIWLTDIWLFVVIAALVSYTVILIPMALVAFVGFLPLALVAAVVYDRIRGGPRPREPVQWRNISIVRQRWELF